MSDIIAPRQVRFYPPTSLRNFPFLTEPTVEGATAESYMDDDIADGGHALNLMDAKVRRFVTAFDNLLTNPQFKADSGYSKGTGWTIEAGKPGLAVFLAAASGGDLSQASVVTSSVDYTVVVKCSEYTSGTFTPKLGTASDGSITGVGITVHNITANGTGFLLDGPTIGDAQFEYVYILDSNDYRFDLALNTRKAIDFVVIDGHNLLDVFPASLNRSIKLYHHSSDSFGAATKIIDTVVMSGLFGKRGPFNRYNGFNAITNADSATAYPTGYPFTVTGWFRVNPGDGGNIISLVDKDVGNVQFSVQILAGTGLPRLLARNTDAQISTGAGTYDDGEWRFIAGVFVDETTRRLYVGGVLDDPSPNTTSVTASADIDRLSLGGLGDSTPGFGTMDVKEGMLHNRIIAPKELEQMALGVPVPKPTIIGANSSMDNIGGWVFNGTAGFDTDKLTMTGDSTNDNRFTLTVPTAVTGNRQLLVYEVTANSLVGGTSTTQLKIGAVSSNEIFDDQFISSAVGEQSVPVQVPRGTGGDNIIVFSLRSIAVSGDISVKNVYLVDLDTLVTFPLLQDQWGEQVAAAVSIVTGDRCRIVTKGTSDFVSIGAADNDIGTVFTATGAGSGTGTVDIFGAVACYQPEGISADQGKWLDRSSNNLHGVNTNVENINAPDPNNLGYYLMRFDKVAQALYWFLSINEDNDLPLALQKYGQWSLGLSRLFNLTASQQFGGDVSYPGVDVVETDSGTFDATKRYGNRDKFIVPLEFKDRVTWNNLQEVLEIIGGRELPFYMEVLPLDDEDESVIYRVRQQSNNTPFAYLFGSGHPWRGGLALEVDL